MSSTLETLDCYVIADARHHHLAALRLMGAMHRQQVAFQDAGIAHRQAAHLQQVVRAGREEVRIHLVACRDVFLGQDRAPGRDPADDGQFEQATQLRPAALAQLDAARRSGGDVQDALALQRAQVLFGGVYGAKPHALGDFGARRRKPRNFGELLDQAQDFGLAIGQRFAHVGLLARGGMGLRYCAHVQCWHYIQ